MGVYKPDGVYTVIMTVWNRVEGDSRVIKTAASLHESGIPVLLAGLAANSKESALPSWRCRTIRFPAS